MRTKITPRYKVPVIRMNSIYYALWKSIIDTIEYIDYLNLRVRITRPFLFIVKLLVVLILLFIMIILLSNRVNSFIDLFELFARVGKYIGR